MFKNRNLLLLGAIVFAFLASKATAQEIQPLAADQILHVENAVVTVASQTECYEGTCLPKEMSGRIQFSGRPSPSSEVTAVDMVFHAPRTNSKHDRLNRYEDKTIHAQMSLDQLAGYIQLIDMSKSFDTLLHCQWQSTHSYVDCHLGVKDLPTPKADEPANN